jgi:transposase
MAACRHAIVAHHTEVVHLFAGIDSHKDTLAACLVDQTGRCLHAAVLPNTPAGHRRLAAWLDQDGPVDRVGIEGAANLGAGVARLLADAGLDVREVPCALTVRERRRLRRPGKSDPTDALAIARITARDHDLPPARQAGLAEDLKVLSDHRDELLVWRTTEANRLHADLAILCPGYAQVCRRLTAERSLAAAEQLLAGLPAARAQVARCRIARLRELDREIRTLAGQLATLVAASRTRLVDLVGIGPVLAARILGEVGDVARFPNADHFAAANGTAPIPVASGRTDRHRLNRGGNRRLNRAVHYVALTQATFEPRAVAYLARKQAEGKTKREALRCLKRRLSNAIFKALLAGPKPPPGTADPTTDLAA